MSMGPLSGKTGSSTLSVLLMPLSPPSLWSQLSLSLLFLLCDSILCSGSLCILGMIMMNWETVIMIMNVCLACCIFIVMNHCDLGLCDCDILIGLIRFINK